MGSLVVVVVYLVRSLSSSSLPSERAYTYRLCPIQRERCTANQRQPCTASNQFAYFSHDRELRIQMGGRSAQVSQPTTSLYTYPPSRRHIALDNSFVRVISDVWRHGIHGSKYRILTHSRRGHWVVSV
ncbi:hypothetical protein BV22DRAFT_607885 [Leucogyrophana mollusca]|uniref:Uncharacterized protein n=1 Tax=Leucogyrophana mollusca TaxID=85980 RepID=A0ACB8BCZ4_9AGAM|nr:hypothetical protein BV22DRAFT_607885 [Leucogyrophana mollusca]